MPEEIPVVSVVLPFFNAQDTLERAVDSIAYQSLGSFECILVNNNSTDKSVEIAQGWTEKDKRFVLIHESRQGVNYASNTGTEHSRGRYIARMDSDDWSFPERLKLQADFLDSNPGFAVVAGIVEHIGDSDKTRGFARYVEWVNSIRTYQEILNSRFIELPIVNPSAMWRKEVGEKYGLYRSGDFPEDYEMWLRWLKEGVKIEKLDDCILKWFDSETRLTRTQSIYSDAAFYRIKSKYLAEWLDLNNPFHPWIAVWGASRISRRRARLLKQYGVEIVYYIDIKKSRQLDEKVLYHEDIPPPGELFILTYIKQMNARAKIRKFLLGKGYKEGSDFLLVS